MDNSLLVPPFLARLASAEIRKVVLVGCGGGFDFVHSLLLFQELRRLGKEVIIVSNSFGNVDFFLDESREDVRDERGELLFRRVLASTRHRRPGKYAPEVHVLDFLDMQFPADAPHAMYACNARRMVVPTFASFLADLGADAYVAFDGGTDSLVRGDEHGLGDPIEDAVTVAAIEAIPKTGVEPEPLKILVSVGFGCDRYNGVSDCASLRAVAELTREGAFLGSVSVGGEAMRFYRAALEHVYAKQSFRSVLAACIATASRGGFGHDVDPLLMGTRVKAGDAFLWPLMAMMFAFDLPAVARRSLVVGWVRPAKTVEQLHAALGEQRARLARSDQVKPVEELPLHVDYDRALRRKRCMAPVDDISQHPNFAHSGTTPNTQHRSKGNRAERIILVRHGESLGNVDERSYGSTADWLIPLTQKGKRQAMSAGQSIRRILSTGQDGNERGIFFYVSPYLRTRQTLRGILSQLDRKYVVGLREEPRISEQQFGNFQDLEKVRDAKAERSEFGRFYFRFPNGESGCDVYSRVTSFISTLFRDCEQLRAEGYDVNKLNLCIVTHGLTLRLFLMRWFQYSVHEFEESNNPENGSVVVLERFTNPETGVQWYELTDEARGKLNLPAYAGQSRFRVADDLSLLDDTDWDDLDVDDIDDSSLEKKPPAERN